MPNRVIRRMDLTELKDFYYRIKQDFPVGEYSPYDILYQMVQSGVQEATVFCEGTQDLAYSYCAVNNGNGYILISLLAVFPEFRGKGVGSAFLRALGKKYEHKQAIIVEVECPRLSQTTNEHDSRKRWIEFYIKAGFYIIPDVDYTIWDIPMHLMALPIMASKKIINQDIKRIMYQIYYPLLGEQFIHKMSFK